MESPPSSYNQRPINCFLEPHELNRILHEHLPFPCFRCGWEVLAYCTMAYINLDLVNHAAKVFQNACVPSITNVSILKTTGDTTNINVTWEQSNHLTQKKSFFSTLYSLNLSGENKLQSLSNFPIEYSKPLLEAVSSSKKLKAIIRKNINPTTKKDEQLLEIWSSKDSKLEKVFNLTSFDQHGDVNADIIFGTLQWSPDEDKLVYISEKKQEKSCGFFEKPPCDAKDIQIGTKYIYDEENWGELLTDTVNPVICVFDLLKEKINVYSMTDILDGMSPSQPQWGPENSIIFSGLKNNPFRLGRIYCENRTSHICKLIFKDGAAQEVVNISGADNTSNTCLRINPLLNKAIFIHCKLSPTGSPHRGNESLAIFDFEEQKTTILQDLMYKEKRVELYVHMLPENVWLDEEFVAIPNMYNGNMYVCIVSTVSSAITSMIECCNFLGVENNLIFTSIGKMDESSIRLQVITVNKGKVIDLITEVQSIIDTDLLMESITDENGLISYSLMPKHSANKIPLVVCAHGGPHSVYTNSYYCTSTAFCKLGYAVLLVNYRGSTGFTNESLISLPGKVGDQDVKDVHSIVLKFVLSKSKLIDEDNIFYLGGSHGGFLGAHLLGQYPDYYCAAALRNPVIDIASMSMVTDIPDWCYFETGIPYTQDTIPNPEAYKEMLMKSPIVYLRNIKAPILLCIGGKDARVPPSQGKGFYRLLKANNKTVKLLYYPNESHPLNKEAAGDVFMNTFQWFHTNIKK